MGACKSVHTSDNIETKFYQTYVPPPGAEHYKLQTATFTDFWDSMRLTDWSKVNAMGSRDAIDILKRRLHAYMKEHVCMERNVVIIHGNRTWVFGIEYHLDMNEYRVITIR